VQFNGFLDDVTNYIQGKATAGAEAAIPEIQQQVKATVQPYVLASLALGLLGVMFGLTAFVSVKRLKRSM
jgi:hypothetical protein